MDVFRLIADRKIQEAMDEGAFDQLSGTGLPLDLGEDPFEDPALRMAHRLLRNNGFAPGWIEVGKEIDAAVSSLRRDQAEGRISPEALGREVAALNHRILSFNLQAPAAAHKLPVKM